MHNLHPQLCMLVKTILVEYCFSSELGTKKSVGDDSSAGCLPQAFRSFSKLPRSSSQLISLVCRAHQNKHDEGTLNLYDISSPAQILQLPLAHLNCCRLVGELERHVWHEFSRFEWRSCNMFGNMFARFLGLREESVERLLGYFWRWYTYWQNWATTAQF